MNSFPYTVHAAATAYCMPYLLSVSSMSQQEAWCSGQLVLTQCSDGVLGVFPVRTSVVRLQLFH